MASLRQGSIKLFNLAGVDVYLHWAWFLVALYEINARAGNYSSVTWNILEYLALFLIVLMHEYGHALACRQVGGIANQIVLWPLGGVAYVQPPQRPGAMLWSIVAGPLVNVALFPILSILALAARAAHWGTSAPDPYKFLVAVWTVNTVLLVFNLLPIYPLDGGQILRSLLWYAVGRASSLMAVAIIGFVGVAGLLLLAAWFKDFWLGIIAVFVLVSCWGGLRQAQALAKIAKLPRRQGFVCPDCKAAPPSGEFWICGRCRSKFDTFLTHAVCPKCSTQFPTTMCLDCRRAHPMNEWAAAAAVASS
jgi:Zn-dependent protease